MKIDTINKNCNAKKSIPVRFTKVCIRFYQVVISPLFPQSCRYYPTCSEYSIQAVEKYGICKGFLKSFQRILKCNPFAKGGFDPV